MLGETVWNYEPGKVAVGSQSIKKKGNSSKFLGYFPGFMVRGCINVSKTTLGVSENVVYP